MASWLIQGERDRLAEVLETTLREGPQTVTKEGVGAVVVVPIDEWQRLKGATVTDGSPAKYKDLNEWLLAPEARFDDLEKMIPPRGRAKRRLPVELE
jgi:antitoxin Phd